MGKVMSEISMSLDGFIAGPNARVGNGIVDKPIHHHGASRARLSDAPLTPPAGFTERSATHLPCRDQLRPHGHGQDKATADRWCDSLPINALSLLSPVR